MLLRTLLTALLTLALTPLLRADGFIVIHNPPPPIPGHFPFAPLEVAYHHAQTTIDDLVAVTSIDQEFYNPNGLQLEGTYLFPLPAGAHIDQFQMDVNGRMTDAELLDADKARAYYEEIVRKAKDPALLEYVGTGALRARIFPIEPHGRKKIRITYTQLLKSDTGLAEYLYPLNTEKFSAATLKSVSVKVTLNGKEPLKAVYSPSHNVDIKRDGDRRATIGYEARDVRPDTDFKLIFQRGSDAVAVDLLTYRTGSDDGYYVLLASPGMDAPKNLVQPKDVCFVLDTSGSMAGEKMEQAKRAMRFCLANLNDGDRFELLRFSTEVESHGPGLLPATKENTDNARQFVGGLKPIGGTAIHDALQRALTLGRGRADAASRPYLVIFLTDGLPTIGETDPQKIAAGIDAGTGATRVFCFGIGNDVNTHLLDNVAAATNAFSTYVGDAEDLEVKVSGFYTKIREPVLTSVEATFSGPGIRTSQPYPTKLPDLFKGEQVVLFGRYSGDGAGAVKITGLLNGERREFATDVRFATRDTTHAWIPRLWATRRVGFLLDEIRLRGESKELKDEVVRLAREHGIVTPYTAYLILEDERSRAVPLAMQTLRELGDDRDVAAKSADTYNWAREEAQQQQSQTGPTAVDNARSMRDYQDSFGLDQLAGRGGYGQDRLRKSNAPAAATAGAPPTQGYRSADSYAQQARVINGRAFYQNGRTWTDATAQSDRQLKTRQVRFNSEDYFALLRAHPTAAAWLSLGDEVDVVIDDTLYQIRSDG